MELCEMGSEDKSDLNDRNPYGISQSELNSFIISNFPMKTPEKPFSVRNDDLIEGNKSSLNPILES